MKVLIYGGGAVGLGIASCLMAAGVDVSIVGRSSTVTALEEDGLDRGGIFGSMDHPPNQFKSSSSVSAFRESIFDYVLICTKSFDTEVAALDLERHGFCSNAHSKFVLFQNGWGNTEILCKHVPAERVFNARVITGFARSKPNCVSITVHADDIHIGSFVGKVSGQVGPLCRAIRSGGVPCSVSNTIIKDLWAKMLYNCPLNSLGAVFEVSYGDLADNPSSKYLMDLIIDECFSVMASAGFTTHWESAEAYKAVFYGTMIPPTRPHFPSTLQDIRSGKPTEIESLNGAIVRLGKKHGVRAPVNEAVYYMIKFKEGRLETKV